MIGESSLARIDSQRPSSKRALVRVLTNLKTDSNDLAIIHTKSPVKSQLNIRSSGKKSPDFLIKSTTPSPVRVSSRPRFLVMKRETNSIESDDSKYNWGKNLQIKPPVIKEDVSSPTKASLFQLQTTQTKYKILKEKYRELYSSRDKEVHKFKEEISTLKTENENVSLRVDELGKVIFNYREEILNLVNLLKNIASAEPQPSPDSSTSIREILTNKLSQLSSKFPDLDLTSSLPEADIFTDSQKLEGIKGTASFKITSDSVTFSVPSPSSNYYPEALALYNYKPQRAEDLNFKAGDRIMIIEVREDGWWLGKLGDKLGVFPHNYVLLD